jgi:hypothetical protein
MWKGTYFIPTARVNWNCSSHNRNLLKATRKQNKKSSYNNFEKGYETYK